MGSGDLTAAELLQAPALGTVTGLTAERLAGEYTRPLGRGAVVYLPTQDAGWRALARVVIEEPGRFLTGATVPYPLLRPQPRGLFLTRLRDGSALLLNTAEKAADVTYGGRAASVPARGLAEIRP